MAEVDQIVSKEAIEGIKQADTAISKFDDSVFKVLATGKELDTLLKSLGISTKQLNEASTKAAQVNKQVSDAHKNEAKALRELNTAGEKWAKEIENHNKALALEVKTVREARDQNIALRKERDLATTSVGKQSQAVKDLNAKIQDNDKFIRNNGTELEKQKINIGNYRDVWNGVKGSLLAAGAALGITATAGKAFELVVNSTDSGADTFKRTMSGLKEELNYFARAVATMDFSNFISGMVAARKEGERYFDQLDLIGNLQRGLGLQKQDIDADITRQRIIAKNKSLDIATREAAIKEILRLEQLKLDKATELGNKEVNNELTNAANTAKIRQQYKGEIVDFVTNYDKNLTQIERGKKLLDEVKAKTTTTVQVDQYGTTRTTVDQNKALILKSRMNEEDRKAVRYAELENVLTDEKRDKIAAALSVQKSATQEQLSSKEALTRIENGLRKELLAGEKADETANAKALKAIEKQKDAYELLSARVKELTDKKNALAVKGEQLSLAEGTELDKLKMQKDAIDGTVKKVEKQIGAYERLTTKLGELEQQKKDLLAEGFEVPPQLDLDITRAQNKLAEIEAKIKGVKFIAGADILQVEAAAQGDQTGAFTIPSSFGAKLASDTKEKNSLKGQWNAMSPTEKKDMELQAAQTTSDAIFQIIANQENAQLNLKLNNLAKERDAKLSNQHLTEKQKAKIEADYAKKEAKIKQDSAKKEKAGAIVQAIINTALAVIKALPNAPLAIAAGIAGAAQTAVIAAQKIPEFKYGTAYSPHNFIAGEAGPEWMKRQGKGWELVTAPMLALNAPGTQIISTEETKRMMMLGQYPGGADMTPAIEAMHRDIVKTIANKREINIDVEGGVSYRDGNHTTHLIDKRVRWAGRAN